ncbi:protein farnesyltransferase subunit beta-like [Tubulanus polymorphus]|uniref:protein farnesyltransferase subunit beta-like n=1 Tax=Tubulanus polymorphus TaxID=672921 RepID=UPI003DA53B2F
MSDSNNVEGGRDGDEKSSGINLRCVDERWSDFRVKDDGLVTFTATEQDEIEDKVEELYMKFKKEYETYSDIPKLERFKHARFLMKGIRNLSSNYECLDASQPWLCYWTLHGLELLGVPPPEDIAIDVANFLAKCQNKDGGFGGGPYQQSHLATTYGAVNALCIIGTEHAYKIIDRKSLYKWMMSLRNEEGAFRMHEGGELDVRGVYCAASVAKLLNLITPQLFAGTPQWVSKCQSYEGGFSGAPGLEAHGGYSFCGFAALSILQQEQFCNIKKLLQWTSNRHMSFEGGFQGRTNKLVDSCYSFWQGGVFPLIHHSLSNQGDDALSVDRWMFHHSALQEYILICCQRLEGGLVDKPGKHVDYYHTCYALSGLAIAQHFDFGKLHRIYKIGHSDNELHRTNATHNISPNSVNKALDFFHKLPQICL